MLSGQPDADERLVAARAVIAGNPIATAIVDRAGVIRTGNRDGLVAAAVAFRSAACPYQQARTLVFAGGAEREEGLAILAELGVASPPLESPA